MTDPPSRPWSRIISTACTKAMPTSWRRSSTLRPTCAGWKGRAANSHRARLARSRQETSLQGRGQAARGFIVTIDRSDNPPPSSRCAASCRRYFTDYLVAMKLNDGWQIVSKSYRYDLGNSHRFHGIDGAAGRAKPGTGTGHRGSQTQICDSAGGAGGYRALARR